MQTTIRINNLKETIKQLQNLEISMEKPLQEVLMGGGQLIRSEAVKSIQTGSKSGIMYQKYNPRRQHRASAPGESPASDTGNLVNKIIVKNSKDQVQVQSNAHYSKFLEYGTSKMQPRPFLFPASVKSTPKIIQATFNKVVQVIKGLAK
tara:strand:- start:37 stop:483 length:447 start_codon:yes stop_codon:yes gene_type:complete